ncbi:MAG: nucleotidyltransferase domain-containing protein [Pseudomonadota bacterium]
MPSIVETISGLIAEAIKRDDQIVATYLFGSSASGTHKQSSDVDLAFLVDERVYASDPVVAISPAYSVATKIAMSLDKETDVTILNGASIEMAYEVISSGRCLYEIDQDQRLAYESKIRGLYFDFMPFIEKLRSERIRRSAIRAERK